MSGHVSVKFRALDVDSACVANRPSRRCLTFAVRASALLSILAIDLPVQVGAAKATQAPPPASSHEPQRAAQPSPASEEAAPEPVAEAPGIEAPVPAEPPSVADPCGEALAWVAEAGLPLPDGVGYHCPSTQFPHQGAACWNGSPCRGSGFIAINMDLLTGASREHLRHVVAHEVCHILDFQATGRTTEAGADACAAAHGAPA